MQGRVIAVANQKGGTGKTTTTVNLAAAIAETGRSVLVVDLDSQRNATDWLGAQTGALDVLSVLMREASLDEATVASAVPGVEVVPATSELAGVERGLSAKPGVELRLRKALAEARDRDVVLIDCLPALGLLTVSGLVAADEVLVPVLPGGVELQAVAELVDTVGEVADGLNPGLRIAHVLVVAADLRQRLDTDVIAALRTRFPEATLDTVIQRSVRIRESYTRRAPVTVTDPTGRAAAQYRAAAAELLTRERTPA
jgi:chromosome partitioning protein